MKSPLQATMAWAPLLALALCVGPSSAVATGDRTITKVVKMLDAMLEKSKKDGDQDTKLYAKFKCYCDTEESEKTGTIAQLSDDIALLESDIEGLMGSTGELSTECSKLKADMASNTEAQEAAANIRKKEKKAYVALKADSEQGVAQMTQALEKLSEVGADQTMSEGADHAKFMAGYGSASLLKLQTQVKKALLSASSFLPAQKVAKLTSFIQAPFTGSYAAQSGEVVGILKSMRDTFEANLEEATETEKQARKAHNDLMANLVEAYNTQSAAYKKKQRTLGSNDASLGSKKDTLKDAKKDLATDEAFLAELVPMCKAKAMQYKERTAMRASEDAAVSEAVAILNKDSAFETFGKNDASTTGATSFLQIRRQLSEGDARTQAQALLQRACAKDKSSDKLVKVLASLEAENPFDEVLDQIKNMLKLIVEEGKADKEQLGWCNKERDDSNGRVEDLSRSLGQLRTAITGLKKDINNPGEGLLDLIALSETNIAENTAAQKTETEQRQKENKAYQADVANLQQAQKLLGSAVNVLKKYYAKVEAAAEDSAEDVKTLPGESEAAPGTWEDEKGYKGQSSAGGKVIEMLEFIEAETAKEEKTAEDTEAAATKDYEESMENRKQREASLQKGLLEMKGLLAEKETELAQKQTEVKKTADEKKKVEAYLESIKPGCDFITTNKDLRDKRRSDESTALKKARTLLKKSPAYVNAVAAQKTEDLGACKEDCKDGAALEQAVCKACLADVTVPAYCAGHAGTAGC